METFDATLSTFTLVNSLDYSINAFLSVVEMLRFLGDRTYSSNEHYMFYMKPNLARQ